MLFGSLAQKGSVQNLHFKKSVERYLSSTPIVTPTLTTTLTTTSSPYLTPTPTQPQPKLQPYHSWTNARVLQGELRGWWFHASLTALCFKVREREKTLRQWSIVISSNSPACWYINCKWRDCGFNSFDNQPVSKAQNIREVQRNLWRHWWHSWIVSSSKMSDQDSNPAFDQVRATSHFLLWVQCCAVFLLRARHAQLKVPELNKHIMK